MLRFFFLLRHCRCYCCYCCCCCRLIILLSVVIQQPSFNSHVSHPRCVYVFVPIFELNCTADQKQILFQCSFSQSQSQWVQCRQKPIFPCKHFRITKYIQNQRNEAKCLQFLCTMLKTSINHFSHSKSELSCFFPQSSFKMLIVFWESIHHIFGGRLSQK